jgi:hypothetical protein
MTDDQLRALNLAIEKDPDAPVNYLLRGEYLLQQGQTRDAQEDFIKVCDLAAQALQTSDWGYILQSYVDRAEQHLKVFRTYVE